MIWQNPIAWAGLLALAVPVLIHMYSRRQARVQMFPSLRFLDASRLLPTRRTRVSDWPLLIIRLAVLAGAVAAMAQPLWNTSQRSSARAKAIARAIIVDTSASMRRAAAARDSGVNRTLADAARKEAERLSAEAATSSVVFTASPTRALAGAMAWLKLQSGRSEVVVISDFQTGTLDSLDLQTIPRESGIRLVPVIAGVVDSDASIESRTALGDADIRTKMSVLADRTVAEWSRTAPQIADSQIALSVRGSEREIQRAAVALRSVSALSFGTRVDANRPVALVYPGFPQRADLIRAAKAVDSLWMVQAVARVRSDATFAASSVTSEIIASVGDSSVQPTSLSLGRNRDGQSVAFAARGDVGGRDGLIVFANIDAGDIASAALIASLSRALTRTIPVNELTASVVSTVQLRNWQRQPSAVATTRAVTEKTTNESDARWLWVVVLVLLGVESLMRRGGASNVT